jgi:mono/diheme cytochrome c family protein
MLALATPCAVVAFSATGIQGAPPRSGAQVTPVSGTSTLHHLGRTIEGSSMGWGGQWSPPPTVLTRPPRASSTADFVLSGEDLYRISCRSCHRPNGTGTPPEINSIIGPVQAASPEWMTARMKAMGRPVDRTLIRKLTSDTEADLRKRLKAGGHDMPSFDHLSDNEIEALRPYLDSLAGLQGAESRQRDVSEPAMRVGELIVKGTCHVCHDATGPERGPTTVLSGIIPPLSSMPHQKTFSEFVQKVREGTPIPLGSADVQSRGRMPVFNYLTEAEAGAAYSYLSVYPPK